jgi:hypothetical protein
MIGRRDFGNACGQPVYRARVVAARYAQGDEQNHEAIGGWLKPITCD